ncbi:MAG: hypothetical protein QT11_C0001G0933 [archaeon GW2011_AR20]|nr:MAG: hypothetical protein QT11_C0001G0933 [archaeon GW2011_AR20]MBS3160157.1 hypothetical protein [Candidatus Woesearchaeota archaeon]
MEEIKYKEYFLFMLYPYKREEIDESQINQIEITESDVYRVLGEIGKIERKKDEKIQITLILDSVGGEIYPSYKIINLLRNKCDKLSVFIPEKAKSAATLMTLGADEIIMSAESELGPLDLPMREHPMLEEMKEFSALDVVRPFSLLYDNAKNLAINNLGIVLRKNVGLSRKDSVKIALEFSKDYVNPIICKIDPLLFSKSYRLLQIAQEYAREFLARYMFKNDSYETKLKKSESIAYELVWGFPEHGFVINRERARKQLKLNIVDVESFKGLSEFGKNLLNKPVMEKIIKLNKELKL